MLAELPAQTLAVPARHPARPYPSERCASDASVDVLPEPSWTKGAIPERPQVPQVVAAQRSACRVESLPLRQPEPYRSVVAQSVASLRAAQAVLQPQPQPALQPSPSQQPPLPVQPPHLLRQAPRASPLQLP